MSSMVYVVGGQSFEIQSRSLRTERRNLENQDGEDVDVLRRPGLSRAFVHKLFKSIDLLHSAGSSVGAAPR